MPHRDSCIHIVLRADAIAAGLKAYFTGEPCQHGHIDLRNTKSSKCNACNRAHVAGWRVENPERSRSDVRANWNKNKDRYNLRRKGMRTKARRVEAAYRTNNSQKVKAKKQRERENNREYYRRKTREWTAQNPGKKSAQDAQRRAVEIQRAVKLTGPEKEFNDFFIAEAYELKRIREKQTGFKWHLDHMVPLRGKTFSGLHIYTNIELVPAAFNLAKKNTRITELGEWIKTIRSKA